MAMVNGRFYSTGSVMQKRSPKPMFKAIVSTGTEAYRQKLNQDEAKGYKDNSTFKSIPLKGNEKKNDSEWILDQRASSNL